MTDRALTFLTHVASQVMGRWLPPPAVGWLDPLPNDASWMAWSASAWLDLWTTARDVYRSVPYLHLPPAHLRGADVARFAEEHLAAVRRAGAHVILFGDPTYPLHLAQIPDPPLALTVQGSLSPLASPMVAVVGSRKASGLAVHESFQLGALLSRNGISVVSGGAFGCDIASHLGVLAAPEGTPPTAVFAGGLGDLYPRAHHNVFRRMLVAGGALVSERLWNAPSRRHDFPARNRIVAGLAPVTAVMQAARKSGALITARLALDHGREVLVLHHPPGDVRASGSHELLAEGAQGFASAAAFVEFSSLLS